LVYVLIRHLKIPFTSATVVKPLTQAIIGFILIGIQSITIVILFFVTLFNFFLVVKKTWSENISSQNGAKDEQRDLATQGLLEAKDSEKQGTNFSSTDTVGDSSGFRREEETNGTDVNEIVQT
jgi:hypothetical protein